MKTNSKAAIIALHLFQLAASFVLLAAILTLVGGAA
jgi:hypothetical protein